jgi:hypothetical protein
LCPFHFSTAIDEVEAELEDEPAALCGGEALQWYSVSERRRVMSKPTPFIVHERLMCSTLLPFLRITFLSALVTLCALAPRAPAQSMMRPGMVMPGFRFPSGNTASPAVTPGLTGQVTTPQINNGVLNPAISPAISPLLNPFAGQAINPALWSTIASGQNPYLNTAQGLNPYSGYGGSSGSGYGYYESELGGYLRGTADILSSESKWIQGYEQARLTRAQSEKERIENRKRALDAYLYQREKTPTFEDDRQKFAADQLRRSLNNPPVSEIWSGHALNTILADLARQGREVETSSSSIHLDAELVRHLNFTKSAGRNPGLLKSADHIPWPPALRAEEFQSDRTLLDAIVPQAARQAVEGRVDPGALATMSRATQQLRETLRARIGDLRSNDYLEARAFLGRLDEALAVLAQPDAGDYVALTNRLGPQTIGRLAGLLIANGWQFAPASPGDETAYQAAHRALAAWHGDVTPQASAERQ